MLAAYIILGIIIFVTITAVIKNHLENRANGTAKDKKVRKFGIFPWS